MGEEFSKPAPFFFGQHVSGTGTDVCAGAPWGNSSARGSTAAVDGTTLGAASTPGPGMFVFGQAASGSSPSGGAARDDRGNNGSSAAVDESKSMGTAATAGTRRTKRGKEVRRSAPAGSPTQAYASPAT